MFRRGSIDDLWRQAPQAPAPPGSCAAMVRQASQLPQIRHHPHEQKGTTFARALTGQPRRAGRPCDHHRAGREHATGDRSGPCPGQSLPRDLRPGQPSGHGCAPVNRRPQPAPPPNLRRATGWPGSSHGRRSPGYGAPSGGPGTGFPASPEAERADLSASARCCIFLRYHPAADWRRCRRPPCSRWQIRRAARRAWHRISGQPRGRARRPQRVGAMLYIPSISSSSRLAAMMPPAVFQMASETT